MSNKRSKTPYPNLIPNLNTKVRQELIDQDYIDKLSPEEKEWLNRFNGEYVNGSFEKTESGKYSGKNLHKGSKKRKDCYNRNNWRKNDLYGVVKSNDMMKDEEHMSDYLEALSGVQSKDEVEDQLLEALDLRKKSKKTRK